MEKRIASQAFPSVTTDCTVTLTMTASAIITYGGKSRGGLLTAPVIFQLSRSCCLLNCRVYS